MEKIIKGDTVLNKTDGLKYIVDSVESYGDITVIFTEGDKSKCIPINEVKRVKVQTLSDYFLKLFKGKELSEEENVEVTNKLKSLKPVTILPLDPNFLKSR